MFPADRKRVEAALSACHLPKGKVSGSPSPAHSQHSPSHLSCLWLEGNLGRPPGGGEGRNDGTVLANSPQSQVTPEPLIPDIRSSDRTKAGG